MIPLIITPTADNTPKSPSPMPGHIGTFSIHVAGKVHSPSQPESGTAILLHIPPSASLTILFPPLTSIFIICLFPISGKRRFVLSLSRFPLIFPIPPHRPVSQIHTLPSNAPSYRSAVSRWCHHSLRPAASLCHESRYIGPK